MSETKAKGEMRVAGVELPPALADAVRACRPHFTAALVFSLLINLLYLAPVLYMLQVYDRVLTTGGRMTLLFVTLALLAALATLAALDAVRNRMLVRAGARVEAILAPLLMRRMLAEGGREQVQAMRDLDVVRQTMASPAANALFDIPWAPIYVLVCFALDAWIGVLALVSVAGLLLIAHLHQKSTRQAMQESNSRLAASHAGEQAASVQARTLRSLGMVGALAAKHLAARQTGTAQLAQAQFSGSRYMALSRFLRLTVQSLALGLGALLAIAGDISAGAVIAGSILLGRALAPIDALIGGWSSLTSARSSLARLADAMRQPGDEAVARTVLPAPEGRLELENIGVRDAQGRMILAGINFTAAPGEVIGVAGPSGSGKTTLAKIIVGAMLPDMGNVRIDGAQRADWDPELLGRYIGYLPQEPSLLEGTIKENIARFEPYRDAGAVDVDGEVIAAARLAGVHDLILKLPGGYDSRLGPLGIGLSAGQAQRIALARALYRNPTLLVLDEPNAFLDAEGEASLMKTIGEVRDRGALVILIAHKKSVLEKADRLLVLENGRPKIFARGDGKNVTTTAVKSAAPVGHPQAGTAA